ncbi:MAG TPA: hypothetical protein VKT30_11155 [Caulobacteraceae bacterium]|nr:hypothetical protein [Caulobacteraceae bacterium]
MSAAILALAVLADSGVEHYRGSFHNKTMFAPLAAAALAIAASLYGVSDRRRGRHGGRDAIYATAAAVGVAGLGFHLYNVTKRPGGFTWQNLFYAAPIGAPAALLLSGLLGRGAERVRDAGRGAPTFFGAPAGKVLAATSAVGLAGTVGEAGLLHFRGAFQNPAMALPVTLPPVAAGLLAAAAVRPGRWLRRIAGVWLSLTAALGLAGVGFHLFGVQRGMGGWRNWSQNLLNGPPLPAPPSFTGLALAGLAALSLMPEDADG